MKSSALQSLLLITALLATGVGSGCKKPCKQLVERLCETRAHSTEECAKWKEVGLTMKDESCEQSLQVLDNQER